MGSQLVFFKNVFLFILQVSDDYNVEYLRPEKIRFSHDKISATFKDGNRTIQETYKECLEEITVVTKIPNIEVLRTQKGEYRVLEGNRRLFLFQALKKYCKWPEKIPVNVRNNDFETNKRFEKKNTTRNDGEKVEIRDDPDLEENLKLMGEEYVAKQQVLMPSCHEVSDAESVSFDYVND